MGAIIPQVVTNRSGAQVIDGSLKFDSGKSQHLIKTFSSSGSATQFTWSYWVKRAKLGVQQRTFSSATGSGNPGFVNWFNSSDQFEARNYNGSAWDVIFTTSQVFRDLGWYHIVCVIDVTQSTSTDRIKIYVNGERITTFGTTTYSKDQNIPLDFNGAASGAVGARGDGGTDFIDGEITNFYAIGGQALDPSYFGFTDPLTNTWKPKKYTGTFGTTVSWNSLPSGYSALDATQYSGTLSNIESDDTNYITASNNNIDFDMGETITASGKFITAKWTSYVSDSYSADYRIETSNTSDFSTILENSDTLESENTSDFKTVTLDLTQDFRYIRFSYQGGSRTARLYLLNVSGDGQNNFYLPMDGNSPIGQDQSGQGNDWTPAKFGGSVELDSPLVTGARPILNTTQGGTQAGVGVFGSKQNVGYAVTVYDDGGGNKYYIDGVKQDTVTGLIRGATYTFDTSDSTVSSHPFRFSATSNGSHGGGSEYTNGVAAITGAATTITVPYNAPNTLYYYCTSHSGMGADITGITTNEKLADQYASHCVLAVPLVGAAGDVSASIACTSTKHSMTVSGAAADSSESNFYSGSFVFDGSNDTVYTASNSSEFSFGSGDFTIEAWVNSDSSASKSIISLWAYGNSRRSWNLYLNASQQVVLITSTNGSSQSDVVGPTANTALPANKWTHVAVTKESNTYRCFIDGDLKESNSVTETLYNNTDDEVYIGSTDNATEYYDGHIQDVRIYKGVAKYTSDFVVPSPSPDILPDTPSGVAGGSKLAKITDGAVHFDGTGDFLGLANSTDTNFGSGDFTVECFAYFTDVTAETLLAQWENGSNRRSWLLQVNSGTLSCYLSADGTTSGQKRIDSASGAISTNRWYHLAYARSGDTMRLFIDGEQVGSVDVTGFTNYANTNDGFQVGSQTAAGSNLMSGFISNARIIKGTGIYTSRFTVPTAPLTNVTNTKLLCCQSNTSATEAAVTPGSITANGDAAANTFNPFTTDINTVRGQETGYATLNPLSKHSGITLSNGNLTITNDSSAAWRACGSSVPARPTSGKYYFEAKLTTSVDASGYNHFVGVLIQDSYQFVGGDFANNANGYAIGAYTGSFRTRNNSTYQTDVTKTTSTGAILQVAIDVDNGKLWMGCDNVWASGSPHSNTSPSYTFTAGTPFSPHFAVYGASASMDANFGQKPFKFAPPDGFQPLNAANTRPVKVISRPDQYVGIVTYSGTGTTSQSITGLNFNAEPDVVWIKDYTSSSNYSHRLADSVRGSTKVLFPDNTNGTQTNEYGTIDKFTLNGFDLRQGSNSNGDGSNTSGSALVAWCWRAGGKDGSNAFNVDGKGYASAAAAGLTGGDITPSGASVGTKQGFSIIQYTGSGSGTPSVPHGLSEQPALVITKDTTTTTAWRMFMFDGATWKIGNLDNTDGFVSATETAPTSSLFYVNGNGNAANTQIAYIWHDVPGLQKFGQYTANANADGPFVELGFRPALVWLFRSTVDGASKTILDSERDKINPTTSRLFTDDAAKESTGANGNVDFLNNGFKIRTDHAGINNSTNTYFYCAWAEAPSIDLYGGGANAR